jgi:hypothetical protein
MSTKPSISRIRGRAVLDQVPQAQALTQTVLGSRRRTGREVYVHELQSIGQ